MTDDDSATGLPAGSDPALAANDQDQSPLEHRAHRLAGAIYGTILATSIVAAAGGDPSKLNRTFWIVLATSVVFWAAHVYSDLVAARMLLPRRLRKDEVRRIAVAEWPMLQSSWPILVALSLGTLHIIEKQAASDLAMVVGIGALFTYGLIAGRQEQLGRGRQLLSALVTTSFGLLILGLKIIVH
jgi:hypothetical protein